MYIQLIICIYLSLPRPGAEKERLAKDTVVLFHVAIGQGYIAFFAERQRDQPIPSEK